MRRRMYFIIAVVVALAAASSVGLAVARGQNGVELPELTPAELVATAAQRAPEVAAVSGDVAWTNGLLGPTALTLPGAGAGVGALLQSGSGRVWHQDGKFRVESQTTVGDTVVVFDGDTAWVYSSAAGTATEYALPARSVDSSAIPSEEAASAFSPVADLPQKIQELVDKLAPTASLAVSTASVAGRDSYVLTMTPTAANTVFGSVQVAFDGTTFVPLRVQVFAKGATEAVLEAGFANISYEDIAADLFEFTPPPGVEVERSALALPDGILEGAPGGAFGDHGGSADSAGAGEWAGHAPLTLEEAAAAAGFTLATPSDASLPFQGAAVIHPSLWEGVLTPGLSGDDAGGALGSEMTSSTALFAAALAPPDAPVVVLRYGEGFGTVMVIETRMTDSRWTQMGAALGMVPMLGTPGAVGDHQAYRLATALGSMMFWHQGDLMVLVAGSVSVADLEAFAASIDE